MKAGVIGNDRRWQNFMDSMEELQKAFDQEGGMMVATVFITKIERIMR